MTPENKNYEIKKTSAPNIFTLYDQDKKPVADVRGNANAKIFAALPEKMAIIEDQKVKIQIMASWLNDYADGIKDKNAIDEFLTLNNLRK